MIMILAPATCSAETRLFGRGYRKEKRIMDAKAYDSKTAAFAGYLIQNVPSLTGAEMNSWLDDPAAMKKFLLGLKIERLAIQPLLEEVGTPTELAAVARFVASEKFVVGTGGELPISGLGNNFRTHLLGVVEENVPAALLKQRKLLKASVDAPILAELGDTDLFNKKIEKALVTLAHVFDFLMVADHAQWFIFYVVDMKGTPWAVSADWCGGGWGLGAGSVGDPGGWYAGSHVVSR